MGRVLLIVRVELFGLGHHAAIERMRLLHDHLHHDGLAHLGGGHAADLGAAAALFFFCCCLCHLLFPRLGCGLFLLRGLGCFALGGSLGLLFLGALAGSGLLSFWLWLGT